MLKTALTVKGCLPYKEIFHGGAYTSWEVLVELLNVGEFRVCVLVVRVRLVFI
jgi:hypothetical protein